MTCVIGAIGSQDLVYLGADSAGVSLDSDTSTILKASKVFKKGEMVIGGAGLVRMMQIIEYRLIIPTHPKNKETMHYMATDFIDSLRKAFSDNGFGEGDNFEGEILIGYRGRLFIIQSSFQVIESVSRYAAVGSGESFALGAMHVLDSWDMSAEAKILRALEATTAHCCVIQPPYTIEKALRL